jgi:hypothetical protein
MKAKALRADGALFVLNAEKSFAVCIRTAVVIHAKKHRNLFGKRGFHRQVGEENMKLLEKSGSGVVRKVILGTALIASLAFLGAGTASARPRVVVGFGLGEPVVARGYYAPAPYWHPAYVGPRYRYGYYHGPRHRYWDAGLRCWR